MRRLASLFKFELSWLLLFSKLDCASAQKLAKGLRDFGLRPQKEVLLCCFRLSCAAWGQALEGTRPARVGIFFSTDVCKPDLTWSSKSRQVFSSSI